MVLLRSHSPSQHKRNSKTISLVGPAKHCQSFADIIPFWLLPDWQLGWIRAGDRENVEKKETSSKPGHKNEKKSCLQRKG